MSNSSDDAEELVQTLLTRLYPRLDELEEIDNLLQWLCRAMYNLYVDLYRKSVREQKLFDNDQEIDDLGQDESGPDRHAVNVALSRQIALALQGLNDDQRITVLLHDSEGYTVEEIAGMLEVPAGTVKSRLNRARDKLKKCLKQGTF